MDFFAWQDAGGVNSYAYSRRVQRSQAEKDAISWRVMGWDWYEVRTAGNVVPADHMSALTAAP